ncbi:hypothetical protein BD779DRAFT_1496283 [Infundibulicybe gibba]|nr:hypothetical protein BD779DRAFT_1542454 [Infundibulicybe gibba]KAF8896513.1 hypothetical protein BD779DRAFT_1496283 [Infundibulicybe gibba]
MSAFDRITDVLHKIVPAKSSKPSTSMSGGIGSGHGMVPFDDDMIVPKTTIVFHTSQIFFDFLAMACFASVASFQAKWQVGPSGLSGFAIFIAVASVFLAAFLLLVPVLYEKYDKFVRLARALKEVRVGFILTGTGVTFNLLIAFIVTISAWTQPGCKNAENDPNKSKGKDFVRDLPGWCSTKKAAAIFFWFAFAFWAASFIFLIFAWRSGKLHAPRDPPFTAPHHIDDDADLEDDADAESAYHHIPPTRHDSAPSYDNSHSPSSPFADNANARYSSATSYAPSSATSPFTPAPAAGRPSMDAYGAFSDPAPSGFGASAASSRPTASTDAYGAFSDSRTGPPIIPEPDLGPKVSRTMQYADPYAAVRASLATQPSSSPASSAVPPSYESYQGYR